MAKPTLLGVQAGVAGWDADMNANMAVLRDAPMPVPEHDGDESDLEATYPAADYARCIVFVEHSTLGWKLYASDGATWAAV